MASKTIAVFGPDNKYLSHCTWKRALGLLESGRAIRLDATTIRLKQTKRERIEKKHDIIAESKRICYICNTRIPEEETATVDHIILKSRDRRADVYDNMRCCCSRCNNDKGNMKLSEYVKHIIENREQYAYITNKRLEYLKNFAKYYEEEFYGKYVHKHYNPPKRNPNWRKRRRR